jgi:AcrR family transcriptional regulator
MNDKKLEFLKQAFEVYMKFGIKSVTMDELARQLGMSKKTIYTFIKDKNDLVEQCVIMAQEIETCEIDSISKAHDNAIDESLAIGEKIVNKLRAIHPSIFFDMQKYHPNAFKLMTCERDELITENVVANFIKGKEQGLYRDNLDEIIISRMYLAFIRVLFSGEVMKNKDYTFSQVYSEYFRYHIRGIASDKGLEYLQEIMKTKKIDI